jgi:hypothetical protein
LDNGEVPHDLLMTGPPRGHRKAAWQYGRSDAVAAAEIHIASRTGWYDECGVSKWPVTGRPREGLRGKRARGPTRVEILVR